MKRKTNSNFTEYKTLKRMVKTASKLTPVAEHRVYCEIYWGGEKVSFGSNRTTHFCDERYMKNEDTVGMHAEIAALLASEAKGSVRGGYALVARAKKVRRGGEFVAGMAKPCDGCMRALRDYGLTYVAWTEDQEPGGPVPHGYKIL